MGAFRTRLFLICISIPQVHNQVKPVKVFFTIFQRNNLTEPGFDAIIALVVMRIIPPTYMGL